MYLADVLVLNSGAILNLSVKPQFNKDGTPKPLVIVGTNGSGKTGLLSTITDGLIEIAALHYTNITPSEGAARQYFRVLGGRTQRIGSAYEISALRFVEETVEYYYRAKSGHVDPDDVKEELKAFAPLREWPKQNNKAVVGPSDKVSAIFDGGVYAFFPSTRSELPYWANIGVLEAEPHADFGLNFVGKLKKPIVVQTAIQSLKPWVMNIMLDTIVSLGDALQANPDYLRTKAQLNGTYMNTFLGLVKILQIVLRDSTVSVNWLNRAYEERRIAITSSGKIVLPTIDCLSTGQSSLLAIFGSILRYGDVGKIATPLSDIAGIVVIDEIDAHLHADLQFDALPALIKLFPKVQFIVTSHAPLFPLGMRKLFGDEGFTLLELPSGLTIDPERFSEFKSSYDYFRATEMFEADLRRRLTEEKKPIVLCEGQTDPTYLATAAELLGFNDLLQEVEFDWIGQKTAGGSRGSGKDHLDSAFKSLRSNPDLISRKVLFLYDADAKRKQEVHGNLFVCCLPLDKTNVVRTTGIENLLPSTVFEKRFFREEEIVSGSDKGSISRLQKVALCEYLCEQKKLASDFEAFRPILTEIRRVLGGCKTLL